MPVSPPALSIVEVEPVVLRVPIATPVSTSFGTMRDRPAVLVRLRDDAGVEGWGEVWCNWPACGAEHRARLVESVLAPMLTERRFESPATAFADLTRRTHILALQTAEHGPIAQAIAGVDIALWDLAARKAGVPLAAMLGDTPADRVPAYASGIAPDVAEERVPAALTAGFRHLKVKIGFGGAVDTAALALAAECLPDGGCLMTDANQAWDLDTAREQAADLRRFPLRWLEEPMPVDRPLAEWRALRAAGAPPLAGGENLRGEAEFRAWLEAGVLAHVQPDIAKWGGISGNLPIARAIPAHGAVYNPHFLGSAIGLVASAHLLAAVGGDGMLEIDANPNPLREALCGPLPALADGDFALPAGPGLGLAPDPAALAEWRVPY